MQEVLMVAVGGAIGSGLRYWLSDLASQNTYREVGTLTVNLVGSLLLGILVGWLSRRGPAINMHLLVGVGVLGGFTTFSTWVVQAAGLIEAERITAAVVYLFGSMVLGVVAAALGLGIGRLVS